ncbi:hypothetical protein LOAG_12862 [Loa loa]|nr:hypothetical protein LOAG_12862 [Loa loa]EFO15647.1 hypothetical protein LOAG_12862 [Loa loa]
MYSKNPYEVPAAGFILVDNLSKLIMDSDTRLDQNVTENLFNSNEMIKEGQFITKEIKREQRRKMLQSKLVAQSNMFEKSEGSTSQCSVYLQTELKQVQTTYVKITELISELLHKEWDEMLIYMKREEEILKLEKECEQQKGLKGKVLNLQQQQRKQLAELRILLRKVLKYQDIVGCELLINIEKLEHKSDIAKFKTDQIYLREAYRHHQRMRRVTLFQTKIKQNLENLQKQMQETIRNSCRVQWTLDTLKPQVERNRRFSQVQRSKGLAESVQGTKPISGQTHWRGGGAKQNFHATANKHSHYDNGFQQQHWRRQSNNGIFWRNNCNGNH